MEVAIGQRIEGHGCAARFRCVDADRLRIRWDPWLALWYGTRYSGKTYGTNVATQQHSWPGVLLVFLARNIIPARQSGKDFAKRCRYAMTNCSAGDH